MRITKEIAQKAATILTERSKIGLEELRVEIDKLGKREYIKTIPKEVATLEHKAPGWLHTAEEIKVSFESAGGREYYYVNAENESVITKAGVAELKVSRTSLLRKKILQLFVEEDNYRILYKETVNGIMALGTAKRVVDQFPEVSELLSDHVYIRPARIKADVSGLKSKLKKQ